MLRLAQQQTRVVSQQFSRRTVSTMLMWGVAWFAGFLLVWLSTPQGGAVVPMVFGWIVFSVLMLAAFVGSTFAGTRTSHGLRGRMYFQGAVFGWTIFACGLFPGFLGAALARAGASDAVLAVYYPGAYSLIIGALFVVSGAMWNRVAMIVLGGWIMIVGGAVAPFLGAPANYLVMAFAGGGAFILYGLILLVGSRWHRAR